MKERILDGVYSWCDRHFWMYWMFTIFAVLIEAFFMNTAKFFPEWYLVIGMVIAYFVSAFCLKRISLGVSYSWWECSGNFVVLGIDLFLLKTVTKISTLDMIAIVVGLTAICLIIFFNEEVRD